MLAKFASLQSILVVSGLLLAIPLTEGIQAQQLSEELLAPIHYREIGPTRQGGRIADFAVNPQDSTTFYVGTANGGVWKTANNGNTFEPIFDRQTVSSIGSLAVAPSDPNVVWVGTGEANDGGFYWGDGVYKSVDGGATWRNMGLSETHHIGRVLIHPDDPNTVYVAAHGKLYSESAERGLYKTTDGGQTWSKVLEIVRNGFHFGVIDVVMDPTDAETLYAAAWNKVRRPWTAWDFNLPNPSAGMHDRRVARAARCYLGRHRRWQRAAQPRWWRHMDAAQRSYSRQPGVLGETHRRIPSRCRDRVRCPQWLLPRRFFPLTCPPIIGPV